MKYGDANLYIGEPNKETARVRERWREWLQFGCLSIFFCDIEERVMFKSSFQINLQRKDMFSMKDT